MSVVTGILSSTIGLLWNKARDTMSDKLKDSDVTDAKIRQMVTRELNEIKTKLDGLSRKDLLSSFSLLKQGVCLLYAALDKSKLLYCGSMTSWSNGGVEPGILNVALELFDVVRKLKVNSNDEFTSAQEKFKSASIRATDAFCNEALGTRDRIFAAKLLIVTEILGRLDSPESAIIGCMSFLQDLHRLSAVREIFSVYLGRGIMSKLNKAERVENVKSVMLINYVLFQFSFKFCSKLTDRLTWPGEGIELADRSFNPILNWQEISTRKSWGEKLMPPCNELTVDKEIDLFLSAVNSHGDLVVGEVGDSEGKLSIISKTGDSKVVRLPRPKEERIIEEHIVALAVDESDNVNVVRRLAVHTQNGDVVSYVFNVLNNNYLVTHHRTLDFLHATSTFDCLNIAISKRNNVVMIKYNDPHVYICDSNGHLKHQFQRDSLKLPLSLTVSGQDEIMLSSDDNRAVHLYSENGSLKSTIKLPGGHVIRGVAFHYVICQIIVLSLFEKNDSYFLLCYSEAGELETSTFFRNASDGKGRPSLASHPSGYVAVITEKTITFI
jgi:hypothetical protein